jgi:flagellar biosynthesis/type III secretory pathway chaperone
MLEQHFAQLDQMHKILETEYQALKNNDLAAFESIQQNKQLQIKKLEDSEPQLLAFVGTLGDGNGKQRLEIIIGYVNDPAIQKPLYSLWKRFQTSLKACHELNRTNNRILEASRINLQQALDILHGNISVPGLYQASGKKAGDPHGQSLAIA